MSEKDYAPLSTACVRALKDRVYDKRKTAAHEIEVMVQEANSKNNPQQVKRIIKLLNDFATSQNPSTKKGGLIGLAAVAIGLGPDACAYTEELINPMLSSFCDNDEQLRKAACESLYNVIKIVRDAILPYFKDIFRAISKLATDPDQTVKNCSELLDRLLKDVVTECPAFDLKSFIPLLRECIYSENSFARQFVISWVSVLDAVPDIDLLMFLPDILDGLFKILKDPMIEIKKMCDTVLAEFLRSIKNNPAHVQFDVMVNTLTVHAQSTDELQQLTAITWIKEFVQLSNQTMLPFVSSILVAILPCLAYDTEPKREIKDTATVVNLSLMKLITLEPQREPVDISPIIAVLTQNLASNSVQTKVAVLKWIHHLYLNMPATMSDQHIEPLYNALLGTLTDPSDEVVQQCLVVLAGIISTSFPKTAETPGMGPHESNGYFDTFLNCLIKLFRTDKSFLDNRGSIIIRQLCTLLNAEMIYRRIAACLLAEENLKFASAFVQALNMILLTSSELHELRNELKDLSTEKSVQLFLDLHQAWCHNPVATLSLLLLTQSYAHARNLIREFANMDITVDILVEIDKLIQLIESPIFAYLRLELLEIPCDPDLAQSLYGLLMLLPQSDAFQLLRTRLSCIPSYQTLNSRQSPSRTKKPRPKMYDEIGSLLDEFLKVQDRHKEYKMRQRLKLLRADDN